VKLWTALGELVTLFAASIAVALQNRSTRVGRSLVGMNPVSLTPSVLLPVTTIEPKPESLAISNL
jgi:hypothetical protein